MVDIQSTAAEIRRGKQRKKIDRKKPQGKNIAVSLLHGAAITRKSVLVGGGWIAKKMACVQFMAVDNKIN